MGFIQLTMPRRLLQDLHLVIAIVRVVECINSREIG